MTEPSVPTLSTSPEEEEDTRHERGESPDEDFAGQADDWAESSSESGSDDDEGKEARSKRGREAEGEVELDEEEAKALQEDLGQDLRKGKRICRTDQRDAESANSSDIPAEGPSSQSEDVWKAMQKDGPGTDATDTTAAKPAQEEMVRVVTKYRFAGEQMEEEKMLPASHPEAKAFLAKQAQKEPDPSATAIPSSFSANKASSAFPRSAAPAPRRKKAGGLAAMSAAATAKPTKINTLEKSKMDWTKYKDTTLGEDQRHELDAQTKGGSSGLGTMKGYMERRNFLERVQDRLEGQQREK